VYIINWMNKPTDIMMSFAEQDISEQSPSNYGGLINQHADDSFRNAAEYTLAGNASDRPN
jgi:hypothetical protein